MSDDYVIDFSDVEEFDDSVLPIGVYEVEVVEASLGRTAPQDGSKPKPFMNIKLKVSEGEFEGRTFFDRIFLNETARWRAKKAFRALGFDVDGGLNMKELEFEIVTSTAWVRTSHRTLPRDKRVVANVAGWFDDDPANDVTEDDDFTDLF